MNNIEFVADNICDVLGLRSQIQHEWNSTRCERPLMNVKL